MRPLAALILSACLAPAAFGQTAELRIVVVEGEAAVNIIQTRTAVAPVVEVRDRNNQPVAGAVVQFAIRNGRATFNGARTLSVTTNAAGRAVATGLTPTGSGAVQIGASAAFQGQTAAVTIAQTNVLTAAQATAVSTTAGGAGTGSGSAAGGGAGAGGGGGGLSLTTAGIIGGAAAGGVVAAKALIPSATDTYVGQFQTQTVLQTTRTDAGTTTPICTHTLAISGNVTVDLFVDSGGVDRVGVDYTITESSRTCPNVFNSGQPAQHRSLDQVGGSASNIQFSARQDVPNPTTTLLFAAQAFSGALANGAINGTVTVSHGGSDLPLASGAVISYGYSASSPVTLQKR